MVLKIITKPKHIEQEELIQKSYLWISLCGVFGALNLFGILEFDSMMIFLDKFADETASLVLQDLPQTFRE